MPRSQCKLDTPENGHGFVWPSKNFLCPPPPPTINETLLGLRSATGAHPGDIHDCSVRVFGCVIVSMHCPLCRIVREGVAGVRHQEGASVGKPTEKEAREAMVECQGKVDAAITKIYQQRDQMV